MASSPSPDRQLQSDLSFWWYIISGVVAYFFAGIFGLIMVVIAIRQRTKLLIWARSFLPSHRYIYVGNTNFIHLTGAIVIWFLLLNIQAMTGIQDNLIDPVTLSLRFIVVGAIIGLVGAGFQILAMMHRLGMPRLKTILLIGFIWTGFFSGGLFGMIWSVGAEQGWGLSRELVIPSQILYQLGFVVAIPWLLVWPLPVLTVYAIKFTFDLWDREHIRHLTIAEQLPVKEQITPAVVEKVHPLQREFLPINSSADINSERTLTNSVIPANTSEPTLQRSWQRRMWCYLIPGILGIIFTQHVMGFAFFGVTGGILIDYLDAHLRYYPYIVTNRNKIVHLAGAIFIWLIILNVYTIAPVHPGSHDNNAVDACCIKSGFNQTCDDPCLLNAYQDYAISLLVIGASIGVVGAAFQVLAMCFGPGIPEPRTILCLFGLWIVIFSGGVFGTAWLFDMGTDGSWTYIIPDSSGWYALGQILALPAIAPYISVPLILYAGLYFTLYLWKHEKERHLPMIIPKPSNYLSRLGQV